mmetsp:Transcript_27732/g.54612  ORF Transcript_27732/g.54612 Transcript_27732/m.54612 type:complete len:264 (+) Transcript_27732:793-1584(+)
MHKVFEVGKVFRNEGIDSTHNPEFTSCEFYQAFAGLGELKAITQDLLREVVTATTGSPRLFSPKHGVELDFSAEFPCLDVMEELTKEFGCVLPDPNDPASLPLLLALCEKAGVDVSPPITLPRVLDKMISVAIEPKCIQPTFIVHHPEVLSPLAKSLPPPRSACTARLELFVAGTEVCNAYEELNEPAEQLKRMAEQVNSVSRGDTETAPVDADFCRALSYGLPPTAGWGMGIDRLVMLLTAQSHIREVLLFPLVRPDADSKI